MLQCYNIMMQCYNIVMQCYNIVMQCYNIVVQSYNIVMQCFLEQIALLWQVVGKLLLEFSIFVMKFYIIIRVCSAFSLVASCVLLKCTRTDDVNWLAWCNLANLFYGSSHDFCQLYYNIKQIDFIFLCFCTVIDHRWRRSVWRKKVTALHYVLWVLFCSSHAMTSSVIYYSTDACKNEIYLLNS